MIDSSVRKRLSAILAADVVGYTSLMEQDSDGTVAAWQFARTEVIDPFIAEYSGRIVKHTGDGFLAEFLTVHEAVQCAVVMQAELVASTLDFRIGIDLGDIIDDGEDIHGEGVNIAARIEALANPGGICVSALVYETVRNRLDQRFEDLGEHEVKHVSAPVRVFRVDDDSTSLRQLPPLPDKPSIAVLPLDNLSGDPKQEYFSDGITEDIIAELARYPDFLVIARNSSFVYKGRPVDMKQVAGELGVHFILEGSVRKAGSRVRVVAQLIDAISGGHIWAERFDRELDDIFEVQDEITAQIVSALGQSIQNFRLRESRRKEPANMDSYDKCLQASAQLPNPDRTPFTDARRLAQEAITLDPELAQAHAIVGWTQLISFTSRWPDDPEGTLEDSYETGQRAIALDDHNFLAHTVLGLCQIWQRRHDLGIASLERAVALNPNEATTRAYFSVSLVFAGEPERALAEIEIAMRLNPHYPATYPNFRGRAYFVQGRYEEAEIDFNQSAANAPRWPGGRLILAATEAALGKLDAARSNVGTVLEISPEIKLANLSTNWPFRDESVFEHFAKLLEKAGLP